MLPNIIFFTNQFEEGVLKIFKPLCFFIFLNLFLGGYTSAEDNIDPQVHCKDIQKTFEIISNKYENNLKEGLTELEDKTEEELNQEIKNLNNITPEHEIRTNTKRTEFNMKIPEFKISQKKVILKLPQITFVNKKSSFHMLDFCEKFLKTGQYPEFTCKDKYKCSVYWTDIKTKIWEPCFKKQEWVVKMPEFSIKETSLLIPRIEMTMKDRDLSLNLPQITVIDPEKKAGKVEKRIIDLQYRINAQNRDLTANSIRNLYNETVGEVYSYFGCKKAPIIKARRDVVMEFEEALSGIGKSWVHVAAVQYGKYAEEINNRMGFRMGDVYIRRGKDSIDIDTDLLNAIAIMQKQVEEEKMPLKKYIYSEKTFSKRYKFLTGRRQSILEASEQAILDRVEYTYGLKNKDLDPFSHPAISIIKKHWEITKRERKNFLNDIDGMLAKIDKAEEFQLKQLIEIRDKKLALLESN